MKYDVEGWADASKYLPSEFDLCELKTDIKSDSGWHTGQVWDGLNIKENTKVLYWKRLKE